MFVRLWLVRIHYLPTLQGSQIFLTQHSYVIPAIITQIHEIVGAAFLPANCFMASFTLPEFAFTNCMISALTANYPVSIPFYYCPHTELVLGYVFYMAHSSSKITFLHTIGLYTMSNIDSNRKTSRLARPSFTIFPATNYTDLRGFLNRLSVKIRDICG